MVQAALLEERGAPDTGVILRVVADPGALLDGARYRLHGDVIDALADLVVTMLDQEAARNDPR